MNDALGRVRRWGRGSLPTSPILWCWDQVTLDFWNIYTIRFSIFYIIKAREPMRMMTRRGPLYSLVTMFQSLRNWNLHLRMLLFFKAKQGAQNNKPCRRWDFDKAWQGIWNAETHVRGFFSTLLRESKFCSLWCDVFETELLKLVFVGNRPNRESWIKIKHKPPSLIWLKIKHKHKQGNYSLRRPPKLIIPQTVIRHWEKISFCMHIDV